MRKDVLVKSKEAGFQRRRICSRLPNSAKGAEYPDSLDRCVRIDGPVLGFRRWPAPQRMAFPFRCGTPLFRETLALLEIAFNEAWQALKKSGDSSNRHRAELRWPI
jgi:hypothetical protein